MIELNKEMNRVLHEVSVVGDVSLYKWIEEKMGNEWKGVERLVVNDMYRLYLAETGISEKRIDIRWFRIVTGKHQPH